MVRQGLRGRSILVVDDDEDTRELMGLFLRPTGALVRQAQDGYEALVEADHVPPDLVFCDILMPGLDGYAVMNQLQRDPRLRRVPVVAITALGTDSDVVDTCVAGFIGHLVKPLTQEMVFAQLKRVFGRLPNP